MYDITKKFKVTHSYKKHIRFGRTLKSLVPVFTFCYEYEYEELYLRIQIINFI